ncbi:hypothetical protein ACTXPX_15110 [Glutamicibacter arilaitensis]
MQTSDYSTIDRTSLSGLPIHGKLTQRDEADTLICFMPAAISKSIDRNPFQLSRFRWRESLPKHHVLALADPAISIHHELRGGWYLHPEVDLITELAETVQEVIDVLGLDNQNVLFYGSSLGGYGALAMASLIERSAAISEVPQINVSKWPINSAIRNIEKYLIKKTFDEFKHEFPHMVDLRSRFAHSGNVPNFRIVTNSEDPSFALQKEFMDDIRELDITKYGRQKLDIMSHLSGHRALGQAEALKIIEDWASGLRN